MMQLKQGAATFLHNKLCLDTFVSHVCRMAGVISLRLYHYINYSYYGAPADIGTSSLLNAETLIKMTLIRII